MRGRLMLALVLSALLAQGAQSGDACGDPNNPMVTREGFGVGRCAMQGPRYHIDDWAAARVHGYVRYAGEGDPMVWDNDQWQTRLMGYSDFSDGRYDRRYRSEPMPGRIETRRIIQIYVHSAPRIEDTVRTPARPLDLRSGARVRGDGRVARARHSCPKGGVLVLSWNGYRERASCLTSSGSRSAPPKRGMALPGRG